MTLWTHIPRLPILIWCLWAFLFTLWDTAYIFFRPYTFRGQKWHDPYFASMDEWAATDHIYGEQAWLEKEGFTSAQSVINMLEVSLYMAYVVLVWRAGSGLGILGRRKGFGGRMAAMAVLIGFSAGVVTSTKTALYFMREVFSDYKYTGHNVRHPCLTLWGFMNLLYFAASLHMIISFGRDILEGLAAEEQPSIAAQADKIY